MNFLSLRTLLGLLAARKYLGLKAFIMTPNTLSISDGICYHAICHTNVIIVIWGNISIYADLIPIMLIQMLAQKSVLNGAT